MPHLKANFIIYTGCGIVGSLCFGILAYVTITLPNSLLAEILNTTHPAGFNRANLHTLRRGASISEVKQLLGEPFMAHATGKYPTCLNYSKRRWHWMNYRVLNVCFDADGKYAELITFAL